MQNSKFSKKQIIGILKEIEDDAPVIETLRDAYLLSSFTFAYLCNAAA